ncbi:MAG: cupin domain-containing protein [Bacillota bacterium]|nr:cupin domain-containing protein [Bacillota bacterium]
MKIDHKNQEFQAFPNFKGGDGQLNAKMFFDGKCRILSGELPAGSNIGMHTHEGNSEIIFVLEGTGTVICDGETEIVEAGNCHYCPEGSTHSFRNDTDSTIRFLAVVPEHHL